MESEGDKTLESRKFYIKAKMEESIPVHNPEKEEAYLKELLNTDSKNEILWFMVAERLRYQEKFDEAERAYNEALKINEHFEDANYWLHHSYRENFRSMDNLELEKEEVHLRKLVQNEPENEILWFKLALILYNLEKYNESEDTYKKALRINPNYNIAKDFLDECEYARQRYEDK